MSQNVHQKNGTLYLPGSRRRICSCWAHVLKYTRSPSRAGFSYTFSSTLFEQNEQDYANLVYC